MYLGWMRAVFPIFPGFLMKVMTGEGPLQTDVNPNGDESRGSSQQGTGPPVLDVTTQKEQETIRAAESLGTIRRF